MITRKELANSLRMLSADAIQKAQSGHPGMPMGMADIAEVLWNDFLRHNPKNPKWPNRDRFIISNGHGVMLHYALLHLTGYDLSLEDLQKFRQLHARTPGHPEYNITPGIEITTGPLGQGLAGAVGMALAERLLANEFNRDDQPVIDYYTYCLVGDGCLMEGVSHEACSFAGTLGLGKLIVFWDDNGISLDGPVANWCHDDVPQRFAAYHWQVITNVDGHDPAAIKQAIFAAKQVADKPTLICCKTVIGFGSPNYAGTAKCHGTPLGEAEIQLVRNELDWHFPPFIIPAEIYAAWNAQAKGEQLEQAWQDGFTTYKQQHPQLAAELQRRWHGDLPVEWSPKFAAFIATTQQAANNIATREASRNTLDFLRSWLPELLGGSADVASSDFTKPKGARAIQPGSVAGNYVHYGVREFAMACIMNGLALSRGFIPYGGTFLVFADYAKAAIRLTALMQQRVIYVLTHDSIGLGEDGSTHQPIEQLATFRLMPNIFVWRPADAVETAIAWQMAIERRTGPTVLALTRQQVLQQPRTSEQIEQIKQGGYILVNGSTTPDVILVATGSEVSLAVQAAAIAMQQGYAVRVVSLPSVEVFLRQTQQYQETVLPLTVPKIVIEAGVSGYWQQFVQGNGTILGLDSYGASAPGTELYQFFDLTVTKIVATIVEIVGVKS